jgi:hypothetical protein
VNDRMITGAGSAGHRRPDRTFVIIIVWMVFTTLVTTLFFGTITLSFIVRTWRDFFSWLFLLPLLPVLVSFIGLVLAAWRRIGWMGTLIHAVLLICAIAITLLLLAPMLHFFAAYANTA